jgi:hypothetical protein
MKKLKKMKDYSFFILCALAALTFLGCATEIRPTVSSATVNYYFTHDTSFATSGGVEFSREFRDGFGNLEYSLTWTIEKAAMVAGEIGVHWEESSAPRSADLVTANLRHDVPGGKPSPKIYGYFAINLLKEQSIQALKVEPGIFSHIHMVVTNSGKVEKVANIDNFPELKGRSYYFAGKLSKKDANGETQYPFELYTDKTFDENSLGDILFRLQVFENDKYSFYMSPRFKQWFSGVLFETLRAKENGVIIINDETNYSAAIAFQRHLTDKNPMDLVIKKQN